MLTADFVKLVAVDLGCGAARLLVEVFVTLPLPERIQIAADRAVHAKYFADIWSLYKLERTRIVGVMREYNEFFACDLRANFVAFVVSAYGCLDSREDTVAFQNLVGEMKRLKLPVSSAARAIDAALPLHSKIKRLRHKLYAHRDSTLRHHDIFADVQLSVNQVRQHADRLIKIANLLLRAVGSGTIDMSLNPVHDARRLFNGLAVGKKIFSDEEI